MEKNRNRHLLCTALKMNLLQLLKVCASPAVCLKPCAGAAVLTARAKLLPWHQGMEVHRLMHGSEHCRTANLLGNQSSAGEKLHVPALCISVAAEEQDFTWLKYFHTFNDWGKATSSPLPFPSSGQAGWFLLPYWQLPRLGHSKAGLLTCSLTTGWCRCLSWSESQQLQPTCLMVFRMQLALCGALWGRNKFPSHVCCLCHL